VLFLQNYLMMLDPSVVLELRPYNHGLRALFVTCDVYWITCQSISGSLSCYDSYGAKYPIKILTAVSNCIVVIDGVDYMTITTTLLVSPLLGNRFVNTDHIIFSNLYHMDITGTI